MNETVELIADQRARIDETVRRIRAGLKAYQQTGLPEPSHIFCPEALNAKKP